jgi:hypothetical protein
LGQCPDVKVLELRYTKKLWEERKSIYDPILKDISIKLKQAALNRQTQFFIDFAKSPRTPSRQYLDVSNEESISAKTYRQHELEKKRMFDGLFHWPED